MIRIKTIYLMNEREKTFFPNFDITLRHCPSQLNETKLFQALGVFGLCQIHSFVDYIRSKMSKEYFDVLFKALVTTVLSVAAFIGIVLTITGKVSPWTGRFYSLLDPSYAKNNIPIIASVSEHQPTSWSSFYFDLQVN